VRLGRRTLGVVLQDLQVHVCVCDDDVELLVVGEELGCDDLELVFAAAEEHHFVWFFLFTVLVYRPAQPARWTYGVTGEPDTFEGVAHQEHAGLRQVLQRSHVAIHVHESYWE
jgi:hypothetical protein